MTQHYAWNVKDAQQTLVPSSKQAIKDTQLRKIRKCSAFEQSIEGYVEFHASDLESTV